MANYVRYCDVDLDFPRHPVTGDIVPLKDVNAVKRSIRNLVFLAAYDVPYHPEINSGVRTLLFENSTNLLGISLTERIKQVITKFEKRVELLSIQVSDSESDSTIDDNTLRIKIAFVIVNIETPQSIEIMLKRAR